MHFNHLPTLLFHFVILTLLHIIPPFPLVLINCFLNSITIITTITTITTIVTITTIAIVVTIITITTTAYALCFLNCVPSLKLIISVKFHFTFIRIYFFKQLFS